MSICKTEFDIPQFLIDFEAEGLSGNEVVEGFQHLINSGFCWELQGFYGRFAMDLIKAGYCFQFNLN